MKWEDNVQMKFAPGDLVDVRSTRPMFGCSWDDFGEISQYVRCVKTLRVGDVILIVAIKLNQNNNLTFYVLSDTQCGWIDHLS